MPKPTLDELATSLLDGHSIPEVLKILNETNTKNLKDNENSKKHPLSNFTLSSKDWSDFKTHILDGGGVPDYTVLNGDILAAITTDDQTAFWSLLIHLLKSMLKTSGAIVPVPGNPGAISMGPISISKP